MYQWIAQYQERQHEPVAQRVCDREHAGRPGTKQQAAAKTLEALLEQCPRDYGYRTPVWTVPMLRHETDSVLGYSVSPDTIRRALHGLGYRYKRPRYVLARRSEYWRQAKGGSSAA